MAKKVAKKDAAASCIITLTRLEDAIIEIPIIGVTPVIPHRWDEKARGMMPGHPGGDNVKKTKGKRDPVAEAESRLYLLDGDLALPAVAFKGAMVGACRFFDKPTMVEARQLFYIIGEGRYGYVRITGKKELREDLPRNTGGGADLRYRYQITEWSAVLTISYMPLLITADSIVTLVDASGRGGVADWRPSSPKSLSGTYGTYRVDLTKEVRHVRK